MRKALHLSFMLFYTIRSRTYTVCPAPSGDRTCEILEEIMMGTITCLKQTALHSTMGGSDKLYILQLQRIDTPGAAVEYVAQFYYGARGGGLSLAEKGRGSSERNADNEFDKQEKAKRRKGYNDYVIPPTGIPGMPAGSPVFGGPAAVSAPPSPVPSPAPARGLIAMLAEVLEEDDLEAKLMDPNWVCQRKFDGERVPVSMRRSAMVATNRDGVTRGMSSVVESKLKTLFTQPDFSDDRHTQVDGEQLRDDRYVVYDVTTLRDNDVCGMPYYERYASLEVLFAECPGIIVAETAWTEEEKRAMVARARAEDWEGLIFREVSAGYVNGRTRVLLKFKLWATATCRVLGVNPTKRSIQVAVRELDGNETFAGNVTVPVNQDVPEPDALVEVRYLYETEGGMLTQPTLLEVRTDVHEADLRSSLRPCPPEKRSKPVAVPGAATPAAAGEPVAVLDDI
ncbi:hypothetical protein G3A43_06445 [Paraburkholderia aspalathi]|nr:hypothetical protein [Paraburkholderia aspalathi]MBK3779888.1 hypothetical protein [Paraburkholderia aspalathi]